MQFAGLPGGVGKTHLLAATYHAVADQRLYLSFGELAYTSSRLGLEPTLAAMDTTRLLCIDEFELEAVHPVHYAQIATQLEALYVEDLQQIDNQAVALRLVHFVDKLYDQEVQLSVSVRAGLTLGEIFSAAYRHGGYEKKYRRCLSRLHELVTGTKAVTPPMRHDTGRDTPLDRSPGGLRGDPTRAD